MRSNLPDAIEIAAMRLGMSLDAYKRNIEMGLLWCTGCKSWHARDHFTTERKRRGGKSAICRKCNAAKMRRYWVKAGDRIKSRWRERTRERREQRHGA